MIGCLLALSAAAQDSLYVFQVSGGPLVTQSGKDIPAKKGTLLAAPASVTLGKGANLTAIDQQGNTYQVTEPGSYPFRQLIAQKAKPTGSNMTAQYLKYVWKEFMGGERGETLIGATFRGNVLMLAPMDSAKVVASKVLLTWKTDSMAAAYYVFVRNVATGDVAKFETDGSRLALYGSNPLFGAETLFEWTVTHEVFPNLNNLPFFGFELIDRNAYKELEIEHQAFIDDLTELGMSEQGIAEVLCETFGICRFY